MQYRILLVDDDREQLKATSDFLEFHGYAVEAVDNGADARARVRRNQNAYALAILDYKMGDTPTDETGAEIAKDLLALSSELFILMYSGKYQPDVVKSTFKVGVVDFINKDAPREELIEAIECICRKYEETVRTVRSFQAESDNEKVIESTGMVGRSAKLAEVSRKVLRVRKAPRDTTVLITGPTGSGKELVAKAIHSGPKALFGVVNCANLSQGNLMESELFGYVKGAFTGADRDKVGMIQRFEGGTFFLDEIHHLTQVDQSRLLRALNDHSVRRIGASDEKQVDIRFIVGSSADLEAMVERGEFLRDLFYRVRGGVWIEVPALKDRPEDIEPLVSHFCKMYNEKNGQNRTVLAKTVRYLEQYDWPGNVRDLGAMILDVFTNSDIEKIEPEHLNPKYFKKVPLQRPKTYEEIKQELADREREHINVAIKASNNNRSEAARLLGLKRNTLHMRMDRLGLLDDETVVDAATLVGSDIH